MIVSDLPAMCGALTLSMTSPIFRSRSDVFVAAVLAVLAALALFFPAFRGPFSTGYSVTGFST